MVSAQAALSLLCSVMLALFFAIPRIRQDVARLALVSWLFGSNLVHGINAMMWASNVDLKGFAWCDIVTKLVLSTAIAVPGACLCISRYLEMISSTRNMLGGAKGLRNRRIVDSIFCYLIPLVYMPLQFVGQDFRFNLVKGIGCVASIHFSTPASLVVWVPPLSLCIISLTLSGMAIHNSFRHASNQLSLHIESRSAMNYRIWGRTLAISMILTGVSMLVVLFSMFSIPMSDSWISWQHVHQNIAKVNVVGEPGRQGANYVFWWGLQVITICYIVLALFLGEEGRDIAKWTVRAMRQPRPWTWARQRHDSLTISSFVDTAGPTSPMTVASELKSGWDDDLHSKHSGLSPKLWTKGKSTPPTSSSPTSRATGDAFIASSLPYTSPSTMADPLGFNTPVLPSPVYKSPAKSTFKPPPVVNNGLLSPTKFPVPPAQPSVRKAHHLSAESTASNILNVLQEQWPTPPASSPTPTVSSVDKKRVPCSYVASSTLQASRPFEDAYIRNPGPLPASPTTKPRRLPSISSVREVFGGKDKLGREMTGTHDVILMTVVQETV